jgi:hypothetical protein
MPGEVVDDPAHEPGARRLARVHPAGQHNHLGWIRNLELRNIAKFHNNVGKISYNFDIGIWSGNEIFHKHFATFRNVFGKIQYSLVVRNMAEYRNIFCEISYHEILYPPWNLTTGNFHISHSHISRFLSIWLRNFVSTLEWPASDARLLVSRGWWWWGAARRYPPGSGTAPSGCRRTTSTNHSIILYIFYDNKFYLNL